MRNIALILFTFTLIGCAEKQDNINDDPNLIEVTDVIRNYSKETIRQNIINETDDLSRLLKIVSILLDKDIGISSSNIDPNDFMKLSFLSGNKIVEKDSISLYLLPENSRETIRILHNKYMLKDARCIFFGPTANDLVKYKFAFGCSHYARVFMSIVKSLNIVRNPRDMRYVISCNSDDYNRYLRSNKNDNITINGHQFVIVKIKNKWYSINTNRLNDYNEMPETFSPDMNIYQNNYPIRFKSIKNITFLLRKISKDYNDNCNDNSYRKLMNIYLSGSHLSNNAMWTVYE